MYNFTLNHITLTFNLKPHKHITLHQIHKIMFYLATSSDPFKKQISKSSPEDKK